MHVIPVSTGWSSSGTSPRAVSSAPSPVGAFQPIHHVTSRRP